MEITKENILKIFDQTKPTGMVDNARAGEVRGIIEELFTGLRGVDIGCGACPVPYAKPIDEGTDENAFNLGVDPGTMDFIFSSHCMEHLKPLEWPNAIRHWWTRLRPGGILFLYLPAPGTGWDPETNPDVKRFHFWTPTNEKLLIALVAMGAEFEPIITDQNSPNEFNSFMFVARKK